MAKVMTPMKAIRAKCLDCCAGSLKAIKFCTCDGIRSQACPLWPLRFGRRPYSVSKSLGKEYVTPGALPPAGVALEECKIAQEPPSGK